jgi:hypothetical protein
LCASSTVQRYPPARHFRASSADHICVLDLGLASLPGHARPRPGEPDSPSYVVRADAAGATHGFAEVCRDRGVGFSFGFAITEEVRAAIVAVEEGAWVEAVESDDGEELREGAWVTEITERLDLSAWPEGARVIVRKERPHPGAQLSLFDVEAGLRHTAFITAPRSSSERDERGIALLELRQRRHARIEDRIRQAKAAGLRNLPCKQAPENHAWLECVLAAADLVSWSKLICFAEDRVIAHCEIAAFRYRILHMAARLTRSGRVLHLRLDRTWAWAKQLALGFSRLRAAFA